MAGVSLVSCSANEQVVKATDIVARWTSCSESAGGSTNQTSLEKSAWGDGILVVAVKDNDYCGGTEVSNLGYTVEGNNLKIRWTWSPKKTSGGAPVPLTACRCDHDLRFELSNIPRRELNVELVRAR